MIIEIELFKKKKINNWCFWCDSTRDYDTKRSTTDFFGWAWFKEVGEFCIWCHIEGGCITDVFGWAWFKEVGDLCIWCHIERWCTLERHTWCCNGAQTMQHSNAWGKGDMQRRESTEMPLMSSIMPMLKKMHENKRNWSYKFKCDFKMIQSSGKKKTKFWKLKFEI